MYTIADAAAGCCHLSCLLVSVASVLCLCRSTGFTEKANRLQLCKVKAVYRLINFKCIEHIKDRQMFAMLT